MNPCSIDGCNMTVHGHGLCNKHYRRLRQTGSTDDPRRQNAEERFWPRVDKSGGPYSCWAWMGCSDRYGVFRSEVGNWAHRYSYTSSVGPIPPGLHVCHTCDNPLCVNPHHLFLGTNTDNRHDSVRKNRHARGEGSGRAKLRECDIVEIRRRLDSGNTQLKIARDFGVSPATISAIKAGLIWKFVIAAKRQGVV